MTSSMAAKWKATLRAPAVRARSGIRQNRSAPSPTRRRSSAGAARMPMRCAYGLLGRQIRADHPRGAGERELLHRHVQLGGRRAVELLTHVGDDADDRDEAVLRSDDARANRVFGPPELLRGRLRDDGSGRGH